MKRVLIIAYYWPPTTGSGVQRWLKFVKYLPEFGWQPVIVTPGNPDIDLTDNSFEGDIPAEAEVHRIPIADPSKFIKSKSKSKVKNDGYSRMESRSFKMTIAKWVRGNIFIPDSRMVWKRPVLKFLENYLAQNPVDAVITTGPPHSMHAIGYAAKRNFGLPWLLDLRDPMSKLVTNKEILMGRLALRRYERYERKMLNEATIVLSTSPAMPELLQPFDQDKFHCITNGYDASDFKTIRKPSRNPFVISHVGMLVKQRIPRGFIRALDELIRADDSNWQNLEWRIAGIVSPHFWEFVEQYPNVKRCIRFLDYISHEEALELYANSSVLLLCMNDDYESSRGVIPGKLFEYMAARRPILSIGPASSVYTDIIRQNTFIRHMEHDDVNAIKAYLAGVYDRIDDFDVSSFSYEQYSREALTRQLVALLRKTTQLNQK